MADDRIGRYLPLPQPYTEQDARQFVTGAGVAGRDNGTQLDCAIAENSTGQVVGSIALQLPIGRHSAEIGFWLGTEFWGRGYLTEALRTLTRFGFAYGLNRIQIACEVPNPAAAKLAIRAGFRFESIARGALSGRDGPVDAAVFARLSADSDDEVEPAWSAMPQLSDGVVTVRAMTAQDWPTVLAEASNAQALAWGFGTQLSRSEAISRCVGAPLEWLVGRQAQLVISDAVTGASAGTMTLRKSGPPNVVGIGYGILPEFRGRKFTARALQLVSDWAFATTPIVRLELGCKVGNHASARSAEAAGFVRESHFIGRLRNPDDSYSDEIGYGKARPSS